MLRHDPFDLEPAHHLGPQPADAVAAHVAAVERRHQRNVRIEIFHRRGGDLRVDHRRAQVAREQDARHRIVELEVALRVQEVRRHRQQVRLPDRDRHAGVGDRQDAAVGLAHVAEVRQEAFPHARDQDVAVRAREPAPGRGDDVRVRVRGQHIVELLGRKYWFIARYSALYVMLPPGSISAPWPWSTTRNWLVWTDWSSWSSTRSENIRQACSGVS